MEDNQGQFDGFHLELEKVCNRHRNTVYIWAKNSEKVISSFQESGKIAHSWLKFTIDSRK